MVGKNLQKYRLNLSISECDFCKFTIKMPKWSKHNNLEIFEIKLRIATFSKT